MKTTDNSNKGFSVFRRRLFNVIDRGDNSLWSKIYSLFMLAVIAASLSPLVTHSEKEVFAVIDIVTCVIFIIDYFLRWITADLHPGKKGVKAFLLYPFTFMAIIDLLSILPTLSVICPAFKALRVSRLVRVFRVFKFVRYSEPFQIFLAVIKKQGKTLLLVLMFAAFYIFLCALIMFNIEDDPSFGTFFDAIYWACCTLTTVGYGDIYPVSHLGKIFSMVSAIVGIALIALPSGIVTSGYMEELQLRRKEKEDTGEE